MASQSDTNGISAQYTDFLDERVESVGHGIIMASRIVVGRGTYPTRIVLRKVGKEYITHKEYLTTDKPREGTSCRFIHHGFEHGSYFPYGGPDRLEERESARNAYNDYKLRVEKL